MDGLLTGLSVEQKAKRSASIGGSDANVLAEGVPEKVLALYQTKTGEQPFVDLSDILAVRMGIQTEPLNAYWFERAMSRSVTARGEERRHNKHSFLSCTLDGMTTTEAGLPAVFEAKHTNGARFNPTDFAKRYHPQLHHNMFVTGTDMSYLSVFYDNNGFRVFEVPFDPFYHGNLLKAELDFWACVEARKPPFGRLNEPVEPSPSLMREIDMAGNNEWATFAEKYRETKAVAEQHKAAIAAMKSMVPGNASRAAGYGVQFKRDARGALRFKEI